MIAPCLKPGGTIGICSPSHIPCYEAALGQGIPQNREYKNLLGHMEAAGFRVVTGKNLYKKTWGYLASDTERGDDLNQLAADKTVGYILFGGGEGSPEVLPYLDFKQFQQNPKRICSYSDGTTILNSIWAMTGLETYYGQNPVCFAEPTNYNLRHFEGHILSDNMLVHEKNSFWRILTPGKAEGTLIGGYTLNFCLLLGTEYFPIDLHTKYILFLEDHERYSGLGQVSAFLAHIEQSDLMRAVTGLIFGNYMDKPCPELYARLRLLGQRHHIPVVYCDDFGHGKNHAILPIGRKATFNTDTRTLSYCKAI